MEDAAINKSLQAGDKEAFGQAFLKYYTPLCTYAHSILRNEEEAKDAVQDCFTQLCNRPDLWPRITDIRAYMHQAVKNRCLRILRDSRVYMHKLDSYIHLHLTEQPVQGPEILKAYEVQESKNKLAQVFSFLTKKRVRAFSLVYLEEKSYREAAGILGVGMETVKTQLRQGRAIIRTKMGITSASMLIAACLYKLLLT
ncbi:RNA polymerase sigma factor [Chitinophaga lutea]